MRQDETLRSLSENVSARISLSEELYEIFLARSELQNQKFKKLLFLLIKSYKAYVQHETVDHREEFIKAREAMKSYCASEEFFGLYIHYYECNKLSLGPKTQKFLKNEKIQASSTWLSLENLGKGLVLFLATVPAAAANPLKRLQFSTEESKALANDESPGPVIKTQPSPPQSLPNFPKQVSFNRQKIQEDIEWILKNSPQEKNQMASFELGHEGLFEAAQTFYKEKNLESAILYAFRSQLRFPDEPSIQPILLISVRSKLLEKMPKNTGAFDEDWDNFNPKSFYETSRWLSMLRRATKEMKSLLSRNVEFTSFNMDVQEIFESAAALVKSFKDFPSIEFFTQRGIQIPPGEATFQTQVAYLNAGKPKNSREFAAKGIVDASIELAEECEEKYIVNSDLRIGRMFLKQARLQVPFPDQSKRIEKIWEKIELRNFESPVNWVASKVFGVKERSLKRFPWFTIAAVIFGFIRIVYELLKRMSYRQPVQEAPIQAQNDAPKSEEKKAKKEKRLEEAKKRKEAEKLAQEQKSAEEARAAEEKAEKRREAQLEKDFKAASKDWEVLKNLVIEFDNLEEKYQRKYDNVCVLLESESKTMTKQQINACKTYKRSLTEILKKCKEFIKIVQALQEGVSRETYIQQISNLLEIRNLLNEKHEFRVDEKRNYDAMRIALKQKDESVAQKPADTKKSKKNRSPETTKNFESSPSVLAEAEIVKSPKPSAAIPKSAAAVEPATIAKRLTSSALFKYQKPETLEVEPDFQRVLPEREKLVAEREAAKDRFGWMFLLVQEHMLGFEVFINDQHKEYVKHPLVRKYGLLYRLHEFHLLLLVAYHRPSELDTPAFFRHSNVGEFANTFWNYMMHRYFAVEEQKLLACVRDHYHPNLIWKFNYDLSTNVCRTEFFCALANAEESERTPTQLLIDLENAFQDLESLKSYIKIEDYSYLPEYTAACRMVVMIIGEIHSKLKRLPGVMGVSSLRIFSGFLTFLEECKDVRDLERHESKLLELKFYVEQGWTVRIDKVGFDQIKSIVATAREFWENRKETKIFEIIQSRIKKLSAEPKAPPLREIGRQFN